MSVRDTFLLGTTAGQSTAPLPRYIKHRSFLTNADSIGRDVPVPCSMPDECAHCSSVDRAMGRFRFRRLRDWHV